MMETMIPPQVGTRLWTKNKIKIKKRPKKEKGPKKVKKKEKKRDGAMLLCFYHTCASK